MRRVAAVLALVALFTPFGVPPASAHAGLVASDPPAGSILDAGPTKVRLRFSEQPQPSLSWIRVTGAGGGSFHTGDPQPVPGDPMALDVRLRPPAKGLYTVTWRTVSTADGHPTSGAFDFGVGVTPAAAAGIPRNDTPGPPWSELAGRWILITGLVLLLGAAAGAVVGFGSPTGGGVAVGAWTAALVGLVLLADGQRVAAGSMGDLAGTAVGRALVWRAVTIVAAGAALVVASRAGSPALSGRSGPGSPALSGRSGPGSPALSGRSGPGRFRGTAMGAVACATAAAMLVDVAAGHAAGHFPQWPTIVAQWTHFLAVGVWLGGLVALLVGLRSLPSDAHAVAVRRFARLAMVALGVVALTGVVRALGEVPSWADLTGTAYGRLVLTKVALIAGIVVLAAVNRSRMRGAPRPGRALRRLSAGEIVLAAGALGAAAALASVAPPTAAQNPGTTALAATGADYGTTVRATLTTRSAAPGPNLFAVNLVDFDSGRPVGADQVSLRFAPLDDPGVTPSALPLRREREGSWAASGTNLSADGRWKVSTVIERSSGSVVVPLELDVPGPPQFLSVQRLPEEPVRYTVELAAGGYARLWADPRGGGETLVHAAFFDHNGDPRPIDHVTLTVSAEHGEPVRQNLGRSDGTGHFVADVMLSGGRADVAVVARATDGARLRAVVELDPA